MTTGWQATVKQDEPWNSCRDWADGTLVCWHRRWTLGDEQPKVSPHTYLLDLWETLAPQDKEDWETNTDPTKMTPSKWAPDDLVPNAEWLMARMETAGVALFLTVYCYEHSNIALSTNPFGDRWDSGACGFIYMTRDTALAIHPTWKRMSRQRWAKIADLLRNEVAIYSKEVSGEVYRLEIMDAEGNSYDTIEGIYGRDAIKDEIKALSLRQAVQDDLLSQL